MAEISPNLFPPVNQPKPPLAVNQPQLAVNQAAPQTAVNQPQVAVNQPSPGVTAVKPPVTPPVAAPDDSMLPTSQAPSDPFSTTAAKVNPVGSAVDQSTETVQGQLKGLFEAGNPLMVQARNRAMASAAGRGLQNSSLAAGAGEQALFNSAMPIAQQDAQTYANRAILNNDTTNKFLMNEQLFGQDLAKTGMQGNVSSRLQWEKARQDNEALLLQGKINFRLSEQDFQNKMGMSKEEFRQKLLLSDKESENRINEIRASGDVQAYLDELNAGYKRDLTVLEGDIARDKAVLDHANRLVEMVKGGEIEASLLADKYGFDSKLSAQENIQRLSELAAQGDINAKLQLQQFNYDTLLADQRGGIELRLEDKRIQGQQNAILLEYSQRGVLSEQEAQQEMERLNQQHANTLEQIAAQADAAGVTDAAQSARAIQSQYLNAVSGRQMAASEEIARIYQTEGLSSAQQNAAVQNAYNRMRSDITLLGTYYSNLPVWPEGASTTVPDMPMPTQVPVPTDGGKKRR